MSDDLFGRRVILFDSSAFLALASTREAHHDVARRVQSQITGGGWQGFTTRYILAETHALAVSRRGQRFAFDLIEQIERSNIITVSIEEEDWQQAKLILHRYLDKDFSFTDALSFAVMDRLDVTLAFTFDHHFRQYGLQVVDEFTV